MSSDEVEGERSESTSLQFYIEGVVLTSVSFFGISGNLMCLIVFFRSPFRSAFSNLLRGLALCDALFLLTAILGFGCPQLSAWYREHVFAHITAGIFGLLHTARVGSVYVTMAVTLERLLVVVWPLHAFESKAALLPSAILFALLFNLPKFFEVQAVYDHQLNAHVVVMTPLRENPLYATLYVFWAKLILTELIPYVTIIVLNVVIVCKMLKAQGFRRQIRAEQSWSGSQSGVGRDLLTEQISLNRMAPSTRPLSVVQGSIQDSRLDGGESRLRSSRASVVDDGNQSRDLICLLIGLSLLFVACQSLKILPDLFELFFCESDGNCNRFKAALPFVNLCIQLSHLLVCVNSAANFLFYFLHGQKFRAAFKRTFISPLQCKEERQAAGQPEQRRRLQLV